VAGGPADSEHGESEGLRFALTISHEAQVVHIGGDTDEMVRDWERLAAGPARRAGLPEPTRVTLRSPYRMLIHPIVDYVLQAEKDHSPRTIALCCRALWSGTGMTTSYTISGRSC